MKRSLCTLFFIVLLSTLNYGQRNSNFKYLANKLDTLTANFKEQICYIQTSKDIYESGEDLWFKAYLLNKQTLQPSQLSKTLYLRMVNSLNKKVYWKEKYAINRFIVEGHVFINDTLPEGNYQLQGCTQYSIFKNDKEFKDIRSIDIKNSIEGKLLLSEKFDKQRYALNDKVTLSFRMKDEFNVPQYAKIKMQLQNGKNILLDTLLTTNRDGACKLTTTIGEQHTPLDRLIFNVQATCRSDKICKQFQLPQKIAPQLQFNSFAEGGELINNIKTQLAFKAVDQAGMPVEVKGVLLENGKVIDSLSTTHAGMGKIMITPKYGSRYQIGLKHPLAKDTLYNVAPVRRYGLAMKLDGQNRKKVYFTIQNNGLNSQRVYIRGQMRGQTCAIVAATIKDVKQVAIPTNLFSSAGIAEFTLFDNDFKPIAERLVYIHLEKRIKITVDTDKKYYQTRDKVNLHIKAQDENGKPVVANLGLSVFDKIYSKSNSPYSILSHCFLNADLRGKIYAPDYYFNKKNSDRYEKLDLLLQTQGWRRYVWYPENIDEHIKNREMCVFDSIRGNVVRLKKKKKWQHELPPRLAIEVTPPKDGFLTEMLAIDSLFQFKVDPDLQILKTRGYIYFGVRDLRELDCDPIDKKYKPIIEHPFSILDSAFSIKKTAHLLTSNIGIQKMFKPHKAHTDIVLEEVLVKERKTKTYRDRYMGHLDSLLKFEYCPDRVHKCGFLNCTVCEACAFPKEGVEYGVWINPHPNPNPSYAPGASYVFGTKDFRRLPPYKYPTYTESEILKMLSLDRTKAYYKHREFYQPNYDKENIASIPDARNTLIWEPNIITDENGEADLTFFCSDLNVSFLGRIEGIDAAGNLGFSVFEFGVRKNKQKQ